jgi:hypothetical protein
MTYEAGASPDRRKIVTADEHLATLREIKVIFDRVSGLITDYVGAEPRLTGSDERSQMRRTTTFYGVWFLPGPSNGGPVTMSNHGFHMILDYGIMSTLKIKTWGSGWATESTLTLPPDWVRAEKLIMDTLPPSMKPENCPNCGDPMHGSACVDEARQWQ